MGDPSSISEYKSQQNMERLKRTLDNIERAKAIHDVPYKFLGLTIKKPPRHTTEHYDQRTEVFGNKKEIIHFIDQYRCVVCGKSEFEETWHRKIAGTYYLECKGPVDY
jgi:hypothetical protein